MTTLVGDGFIAAARRTPDKIAVIDGKESIAYHAMADRVQRFAVFADANKARRIALLCENRADFIAVWLGAVRAGAVAFVMEPKWPSSTSAAMIAAHQPHVLFTDNHDSAVLAAARACGALTIDREELNSHLKRVVPASPPTSKPSAEMPFLAVFTSGTTGIPKAVIRSHRSWIESFKVGARHLGTGPNSRVLAPGPLSHGLSLFAVIEALNCGATVGIQRKFNSQQCVADLRSGAFSTLVVAPTLLDLIVADAGAGAVPETLRIITAGSKLPPDLVARARNTFPNAEVIEYYGATELSFVAAGRHGDGCPPGSVGRACAGVDIEIRDENGEARASGETGTIWVASAMISNGYAGQSDGAGFRQVGRWATVGDQGYLDADGYLYVAGRSGDMLISGGYNAYPAEIESVIAALPGIRACAVAGVTDPRWGEVIGVAIVPIDGAKIDLDAVRAACADHLPVYKIPRRWVLVDALPMTPSGKINRTAAADMLGSES